MKHFDPSKPDERIVWIHAGPHKTASTYLVRMLRENRKALAAQHIYIPADSESESKKLIDQDWTGLDQLISQLSSKTKHYLISREVLHNRIVNPAYFKPLLDLVQKRGFRLGVIYVIRDQADWINSMYTHGIRRFYPRNTFSAYCKKTLKKGSYEGMQYRRKFKDIMREKAIYKTFIPLSEHYLVKDPYLALAKALKWQEPRGGWNKVNATESNLQPGRKAIWLSKLCRQILIDINIDPKKLHQKGRTIRNIAFEKEWHLDRFYGFSPKLYRQTRQFYSQSNEWFSQYHWQCSWTSLFPERDLKKKAVYRGPQTNEERNEMLTLLLTAMEQMQLPKSHLPDIKNAFLKRCYQAS